MTRYDVAVIGAGVFGAWTAYQLRQSGKRVLLVDAYGPANARASSGGESRILRMGYGRDEIYTRWALRALQLWKDLLERIGGPRLFHQTGVLWLAQQEDHYERSCLEIFAKLGVAYEELSRADVEKRFPQFNLEGVRWGFLEPLSGVMMARRAVDAVVAESVRRGVEYRTAAAVTPTGKGELEAVRTQDGGTISAGVFVFAAGPWLPKVFPDLLGSRVFPTRQEVYFFGVPAGESRFRPPSMPTWIFLADEFYGMPDLENRGFKIGSDRHGPAFDPDSGSRVVNLEGVESVRQYLGRRFPRMKGAPVVETRVCQYENTSNGDFLIDRHPDFDNVWLVGGGSGHGFKHGPVLGEYVAARILEGRAVEPRFTLATKAKVQRRAIF